MSMPVSYVYKITNKINNKVYIGKSNNPSLRFKNHIYRSKGKQNKYPIHYAIKKYGEKYFIFEIIEQCINENEAYIREEYWMKYYNSTNNKYGYNIRVGNGIIITSEYTIKEKSKFIKNFIENNYTNFKIFDAPGKYSKNFKECILFLRKKWKKIFTYKDLSYFFKIKGNVINKILNSYKNGIPTEEQKSKNRSLGHLGKKHSLECRKKISESNSGKKHTEEMKKKLSKERMGIGNPMYNRPTSIEARQKQSDFQSSRTRKSLTKKHKSALRDAAKLQDFSFRVPIETKIKIRELYATGKYIKRQLAEMFGLKFNTVVKIIRTGPSPNIFVS